MAIQCNAKSKTTGGQCRQPAVPGSTKCRYHGGATPRGIASVHWKGKGYSKHVPKALQESYAASMDDPELLSVRSEIALIDARMGELLQRVGTGESMQSWKAAVKANDDLRFALAMPNQAQAKVAADKALRDLDNILGKGAADYAAWSEIGGLIEQRRKLAESEQRRLVAMKAMVTASEAMTFATALLQVVIDNVADKKVRQRIALEFQKLMNRAPQPALEASGDDG